MRFALLVARLTACTSLVACTVGDEETIDPELVDVYEEPTEESPPEETDIIEVTSGDATTWILANFGNGKFPVKTGNFSSRVYTETPVLVKDATACCGKVGFDLREKSSPTDPRAGFVNVRVTNLKSTDAFGGGVHTAYAPGAKVYMSDVYIEPNWPNWVNYSTTNKDGIVLDSASAIYAEDLTIKNWNADAAIDNKAQVSQFVRLATIGRGHRTIRYWRSGPHYIVNSALQNTGGLGEGSLMWFKDCSTAVVKIYNSTFNGSSTVPSTKIKCDTGRSPKIIYLTTDPRTTGEMHPMFKPN
jgi:hypothetical protein